MIELVQIPWSPFCHVQRRILEYSGTGFKVVDIPSTDRALVWRLTRQRYYQVPVIRDGRMVVFETDETSQVIAKYLDHKLRLGLFPPQWEGVQDLLWRAIESEIEECCFKLNDCHWQELVPKAERLAFVRHKERRFGRGCLKQWQAEQPRWRRTLTRRLMPFEQMLGTRRFLLDDRPRFVDFDLYGMLACYLYTGRYRLPKPLVHLSKWYERIAQSKHPQDG